MTQIVGNLTQNSEHELSHPKISRDTMRKANEIANTAISYSLRFKCTSVGFFRKLTTLIKLTLKDLAFVTSKEAVKSRRS